MPIFRRLGSIPRMMFTAITLIGASPAFPMVNCLVQPLDPNCCPSPCPVVDSQKVAQLARSADQVFATVDRIGFVDQHWKAVSAAAASDNSNGPTTALSTFQPPTAALFTPGWLSIGDSTSLSAATQHLVADLLTLPNGSGLSGLATRVHAQSGLTTSTTMAALADGLGSPIRMPAAGGSVTSQGVAVDTAMDLRADWARNSAARAAVLSDIGSFQELLATWMAFEAAPGLRPGTIPPTATTSPTLAASLSSSAVGPLSQATQSVARVVVLHNQRVATGLLRSQYAGLMKTVDSDTVALALERQDADAVNALLNQVFVDGNEAFHRAQGLLLAFDTTTWSDADRKGRSAARAATAVVATLIAQPAAFGALRAAATDGGEAWAGSLQTRFAAWLEDRKLEQFWHPLRLRAEAVMAVLDQRIAAIGHETEPDGTPGSAVQRENALIDRAVRTLIEIEREPGSSTQAETLASERGRRIQQILVSVQSDPQARRFITGEVGS